MRIKSFFLIIIILQSISCTLLTGVKKFEKSDVETLNDRTIYLLPFESITYVDSNLKSSADIDLRLKNTIIEAIKNFDKNKFNKSLEERYSLKVDTTYFDAIWNNPELNSEYLKYLMKDKTSNYKNSKFYKDIKSLEKSTLKNYIKIEHRTTVMSVSSKTNIYIKIKINTPTEGPKYKFLSRNFIGGYENDKKFFKTAIIDFDKISKSISNIADYRYNMGPSTASSTDDDVDNLYFDGSR